MRKNVLDVTEKQLDKAEDFESFMQMDKERMFQEMGNQMSAKPDDDIQVTPAKAFLSTAANNFSQLALFLIQYQSLIQLSQGKSAFSESFAWIPSLAGPNGIGVYGFEAILNLPDSAPYLIAPLLLFASMLAGQKLEPMQPKM